MNGHLYKSLHEANSQASNNITLNTIG